MSLQEFSPAELRQFIDVLTKCKLKRLINLPEIAVMGDTSSGKSSLLSAISGVEFPSHAELTTRCPTRLRMEHLKPGEKPSYKVSITWDGKSPVTFERSPASIGEITDAIKAAQSLVLEHIKAKGKQSGVSRDIIEVSVTDEVAPDLTLVDLPGIVRTVGRNEHESLIKDIRGIIDDYLRNERCVILAVVPANVDFHNSQILADARVVDPQTRRTIPVITKPDLVDRGAEKSVAELLRGDRTESFALGFHMVKCRAQRDLNEGKSIQESIGDEEEFFTDPEGYWAKNVDSALVGTHRLQSKLSDLYLKMVQEMYPAIRQELEALLEKTRDRLEQLGESFGTSRLRRQEVTRLAKVFEDSLLKLNQPVEGGDGMTFRAQIEVLKDAFSSKLLQTCLLQYANPQVETVVAVDEAKGPVLHCFESGSVIVAYHHFPTSPLRSKEGPRISAEEYKSTNGNSFQRDGKWCRICNKQDGVDSYPSMQLLPVPKSDFRVVYDEDHPLAVRMRNHRSENLTVFLDVTVFNAIVGEAIGTEWKEAATELCDGVEKLLSEVSMNVIETAVAACDSFPALTRRLRVLAKECVLVLRCQLDERIDTIIAKEQRPYTNNHYLTETVQKMRMQSILDTIMRQPPVESQFQAPGQAQGSKLISRDALVAALKTQSESLSLQESAVREMALILDAYAKVAAKRFGDDVPMEMERVLIKPMASALSQLSTEDDTAIAKLFEVSLSRQEERTRLSCDLQDLTAATNAAHELFQEASTEWRSSSARRSGVLSQSERRSDRKRSRED